MLKIATELALIIQSKVNREHVDWNCA